MKILLFVVFVPLLLCFGSVSVYSNAEATTRKIIFESNTNIQLYKRSKPELNQFVHSYNYPTLEEFNGFMIAVVEARYATVESDDAGEVVAKYSTDQGATWKTIVAIARKTTGKVSRSINPIMVKHNNNLILFAETFKSDNQDWTDHKSGDGDFVYSLLNVVKSEKGTDAKASLTFSEPVSLLTESFLNEMKSLQRTRLIGGFGRGIEVNKTAVVPVWFFKNTKEAYATVLRSDSSNWKLSEGICDSKTLESAIVEWEGKLIMNARINRGYRKVYESTDMGDTWKEALGSLSRVWGNSPSRKSYGSSASFITVTIENTPVMLFSNPLTVKNRFHRYELHLWVTDNKRIYDVGQITGNDRNVGHSSLLYTNGSLYCLYEDAVKGTKNYNSVLAHLVDELKKIKNVVQQWKNQDNAFSEPCIEKDPKPSYPGSACEVHIPTNGLVGFLSDDFTNDKWKDAYSCVDAEVTGGSKVTNGITFNSNGAGAMWPVGKQGQNQRYHFMNHEFTLAATIIIHECKDSSPMPLLSVVLDSTDQKKLMEVACTNTGKLSFLQDEPKSEQSSFSTVKPIRVVFTLQEGITKLYIDGKLKIFKINTLTSGLLSTPISHICILHCESSNPKQETDSTVKNVLLYNRALETEEIRLLYLSIVPTMTPTISKTTSHTNSLSKTLSTTETLSLSPSHTTTKSLSQTASVSHSLSHTASESQSLSHTASKSQSLSHTASKSQSLSHTASKSQSLSHTASKSQSLSHTASKSQSLSHTASKSQSLSHTASKSQSLSHTVSESKSLSPTGTLSQSLSHIADKVCPSIIVKTFPAGNLTQKDVDGSNNGKRILLVSLPKKLYWTNNDSVGSLISFSVGSGADQPNGFSGKWGEMLRNATWRRNTTNPRSVLEVEIPTYSDYNIKSNEEIVISADPKALSVDCQGPLKGSFTIRAENISKIVKTSTVVNSVIAGMTTATIFCAGGASSLLEIQALSLLSRMNCALKEERYGFNLLPYLTSFFAYFGSLWIVLGNAMILVVFGSIHYCVTVFYKTIRGVDASKAWARMFFPSFTYFVAYIMHIGILVHSVSLLFMVNAELLHYVVGIVGTSYGLIFPFFVLYYVTHYIDVQFLPYPHFINQSLFKQWMSPLGYWAPRNQVKMYGSICFTMKGGYLYWSVFRLSVICTAGIVTVIPTTTDKCHIQYFCLMGIFLLGSIVTAVANMMRSVFLTSMYTLSLLLLATLCCISGLNYILPNKLFFDAYFLLIVVLLIVVFLILLYKTCLLFYDSMYVTNDAMDSIAIKEPFTQEKFKKDTTECNTLPYGKEDVFCGIKNENVSKVRNEPFDN